MGHSDKNPHDATLLRQLVLDLEKHPCFGSQILTNDEKTHWRQQENLPHNITDRNFVAYSSYLPVDVYMYIGDAASEGELAKLDFQQTFDRKAVLISCTVYRNSLKALTESYFTQLTPAMYSKYYKEYNQTFDNVTPVNDFSCFIGRMDPSRQGWFYQLIRRNLLPRGFVSFLMNNKRLSEFNDLPPAQTFEQQYQKYMTIFADEHAIAKDIVPYQNFDKNAELDDLIMQSRFNIVLETYFDNNDQLTFTEKIIRSLRLPRPWLLFSSQHAVRYLRDWGFDVLDDLVDHNRYDNIEFNIDRQTVILDMAQELLDFDTVKHWDRLHAASQHNLAQLKYWQDNVSDLVRADFKLLLDKVYEQYYS
jgi:hypothetical protein